MKFKELECGIEKESTEQNERQYIELESPCDDEVTSDIPAEQVPRQSEQEKRPPMYYAYGEWANISNISEPQIFSQAFDSPDKQHWMNAVKN